MPGLFSTLPFQSDQVSALAEILSRSPSRRPTLKGLAPCLDPRKQTYVLSVEMDAQTKNAFDRGDPISVWRCW